MIASIHSYSPQERRVLDRDAAIIALVADQVRPANLSPRREIELIQAGTDRVRHALDLLETATLAATALDREDRAADQHVQTCRWCVTWRVARHGACRTFRRIRRQWDRLYHDYARAYRRLERA
jgi:hypothetical protein